MWPSSSSWFFRRRRLTPRLAFLKVHRTLLFSVAAALALVTLSLSLLFLTRQTGTGSDSPFSFVNGPPPPLIHGLHSTSSTPSLPSPPSPPVPLTEATPSTPPLPTPPTPPSPSPYTPAEEECTRRLGSGLLQRWASTDLPYIEPLDPPPSFPLLPSQGGEMPLLPGSLSCASITIPNMPPPTAPHSFCRGTHLYLFLSSLSSAQAPKHRSSYAFGTMQHYHYKAGAGVVVGKTTGKRDLGRICGDHMRDSIEAVQSDGGDALNTRLKALSPEGRLALCDDCTLLLVTREGGEHVNLYHTMTDWFNAYLMLHLAGLTSPSALRNIRVLLLDNHPSGYLDPLWQTVFTPSYPLLRVGNLTSQGVDAVYAPRVMWVPAGYSSPIWVHLRDDDPCHDQVDLMASFAVFVKGQLGLVDTPLTLSRIRKYFPDGQAIDASSAPYAAGVISQHTVPLTGALGGGGVVEGVACGPH